MTTRAIIRGDLRGRLGEATQDVWSDADLNNYLGDATTGLYPSFYQRQVGTTTAGAGPVQTKPSGAVNLYYVAVQSTASNRARTIRGWSEGDTDAIVPKLNITGQTLIWAWTVGFALVDDSTTLTLPRAAEEPIILRAQISALEAMLTTRAKKQKYFNLNVREAVSEQDVGLVLDALHASVDARLKTVLPLPQRVG